MPKSVLKRYPFLLPALRYGGMAFLVLVLLAMIAVAWVLYGTQAIYSGRTSVPGMQAKVDVWRDEHGVPHIFADNTNDAMRALGYVHASERFFQMEMQRRAGQGRLSEVIGPQMLGVDKFIRTLGLYRLAESSFKALSPEAQGQMNAYAEGVNAWIRTHRMSLPPEFLLLGITPESWKPADSVVWGKLMAYQLSHNYRLEILRARLAKTAPAKLHDLFPPYGDAPVTMEPRATEKTELPFSISPSLASDALDRITGLGHAASNEWVISGTRTDTGKPILANDPHLGLEAPILWYLARIVTPQGSLEGATVPGLPVVLLGQNDSIAWGMTTTGSDVQDLFIETVDPKNPHNYLTPDGGKPFETRSETIRVKGLADVTLNVRTTRHGPVLSDIDPDLAAMAGKGKVMAFAFTGLGDADTTSEALMRINRAGSWPDFVAALRLYQAPPQNIVFADIKGDIGFFNPGLVPVRKSGDGLTPVEGASGAHDWTGMVPFEEEPNLFNPASGFIFNANNAILGAGAKPYLGVDWEEPYRAMRLQEFFNTADSFTLDRVASMQADHVSLAARQLLPYLLAQKPANERAEDAIELLRGWDGTMDKNRPEPLIFEAWLDAMHRLLLVGNSGESLKERGPYAANAIAHILAQDGANWCSDRTCSVVIIQALNEALNKLTQRDGVDMNAWRWGHEQITLLRNKVFSHVPLLSGVSDLSVESSGDFYTLDRGGSFAPDEDHPFARTHAGGYRGIYDMDDPARSRFMIATGQSGHVLSRHYGDLTPLWNDVKSFPLTGTEAGLEARHLPELILEPAR